MRKKGNTVLAGLIICLLFVFLAAAGKLFSVYLKYQKGEASYEKLQEYVQEPEEEESPEPEKEKEEPQSRYLEIDFAGLKAVNPDVIAWIQIPALDISYPVVQGKDNAYYLHHLFSGISRIHYGAGASGAAGFLFLAQLCGQPQQHPVCRLCASRAGSVRTDRRRKHPRRMEPGHPAAGHRGGRLLHCRYAAAAARQQTRRTEPTACTLPR